MTAAITNRVRFAPTGADGSLTVDDLAHLQSLKVPFGHTVSVLGFEFSEAPKFLLEFTVSRVGLGKIERYLTHPKATRREGDTKATIIQDLTRMARKLAHDLPGSTREAERFLSYTESTDLIDSAARDALKKEMRVCSRVFIPM